MANTKRAYKLQEFVAHSDSVNCLKIGRKTSRVLATGGEDANVNIWTIGRPNAVLSLSGHTSAVESVNFDASEVLLAAGAASGTVKLWDLEEAKIVRTLTGHRSNCVSVDFHPFGEFLASGSLDTNLKIWDIRRKGCIHTYKGHTRGVNVVRFTPDGRWVVSGGEDNNVKLWDLTAGKLLHDFKLHDGQIQCIDFHPNEFLLATGSSDKSVKFWDLETFELIGSAGPETTGICSMVFSPDGRTLLCGLQESLKVFSWEPIKYHDSVDVGWSRLSDMNIYDGKLLGCSYNRSCVGVWVVDLSRIEPSAKANSPRSSSNAMSKSTLNSNFPAQAERVTKPSAGRFSVLQNMEPPAKENKPLASTGCIPVTPQRLVPGFRSKVPTTDSSMLARTTPARRGSAKIHASVDPQSFNKTDIPPIIVPRTSSRAELFSDSREGTDVGRTLPYSADSKCVDFQRLNLKDVSEKEDLPIRIGLGNKRNTQLSELPYRKILAPGAGVNQIANDKESCPADFTRTGIGRLGVKRITESNTNFDHEVFVAPKHLVGGARSYEVDWKRRESSAASSTPNPSSSSETVSAARDSYSLRGHLPGRVQKENVSVTDEDIIADLTEQHMQFLNCTQSRLTKLQFVLRLWDKKDITGVVRAIARMSDNAVSADILSFLKDRSDIFTLDLCTSLLPLLTHLLTSKMERHLAVSLEMLLKLVTTFRPVICSALSAGSSVGVDIEAERRLERCTLCKIELEKVKGTLFPLTRSGGSIAKAAIELNLALQEVL